MKKQSSTRGLAIREALLSSNRWVVEDMNLRTLKGAKSMSTLGSPPIRKKLFKNAGIKGPINFLKESGEKPMRPRVLKIPNSKKQVTTSGI